MTTAIMIMFIDFHLRYIIFSIFLYSYMHVYSICHSVRMSRCIKRLWYLLACPSICPSVTVWSTAIRGPNLDVRCQC